MLCLPITTFDDWSLVFLVLSQYKVLYDYSFTAQRKLELLRMYCHKEGDWPVCSQGWPGGTIPVEFQQMTPIVM